MKTSRFNRVGLYTIVRREVVRFMRIWSQTLLPSVVSAWLYFVIFGNFMGPRIGVIDGFSYIEYIVPGLVMMSMINAAYGNVVASFFLAKFQRNIEEMLVSSLDNHSILAGFVLGGMARGILVGFLVMLTSTLFVQFPIKHPFILFFVWALTVILFSLAGFLNGIFAKKFDDINIVPSFVLTPLIYLGGIFYSVKYLSAFWQQVTYLNPLFYIVNAFRFGMLGYSEVNIGIVLGMMVFFSAGLYSLSFWLLAKGVGIKS